MALYDQPRSKYVTKTYQPPQIIDLAIEIYHEKIYSLLPIFVKYVGGSHRKCRTSKHDASANLKFLNWLLSDTRDYTNYEQEKSDRLQTKQKLKSLIPLLQKCNGDVNFVDENKQSLLFIFLATYVPPFKSMKRDELHKATDVITKLLQEGASVNLIDNQGNTPLHIAVKQQVDASIIKILLVNFTEIDACDTDDNTVLHVLLKMNKSQQDHTENISILVAKDTNIQKRNKQGSTPVHLAVERCNVEALKIFETRKINFSEILKGGRKMLHLACDNFREKSTDKAREATIDLLMSHGCDVNEVDWDGCTPLHYAAKHCSTRIVLKLIELGADRMQRTKKYAYTALHLAAQLGRLEVMNTLIEAGLDVNAESKGGITPLHLSILYNEWSVGNESMRFLIENGADLQKREMIFGFSPIHMATFGTEVLVEFLMKNGVDVNVRTDKDVTPLHLASILGNLEVVKTFVNRGANLHCKDGISNSNPLHWVSRKGELLDVDSLVVDKDGYLVNKKMMKEFWSTFFVKRHKIFFELHEKLYKHGERLLNKVYIQTDNEVMEILLRSNSFVNVKDNSGNIPLYYVFKNNNEEGLQSLLEFGGNVNDVTVVGVFKEKKEENEKIEKQQEKEKKDDQSKDLSNKEDEAMKEKKMKERARRDQKKQKNKDLLEIVKKQVIKLKIIRLPISSFYELYTHEDTLKNHDDLYQEVEKMLAHLVNNKVSLYELLHMDCHERSKFIDCIVTHNLKNKFPEYCNIIRNRFREAKDCRRMFDDAKWALCWLSKCNLPDFCVEPIVLDLDGETIRSLCEAAYLFE